MAFTNLMSMASELSSHYSFKVVLLIVFTWVFLTVFHTGDIRDQFKSPKPLYYYTSTNNEKMHRQPNEIDISLIGAVDNGPESFINGESNGNSTHLGNGREGIPIDDIIPGYQFETAKKILYFTSYFDMKDWHFGVGHQPFLDNKCPVTNCYITNKRSILPSINEFDAVLFHIRDMDNGRIALPNRGRRLPKQRYIMFLMESPMNDGFPYEKFDNFFNWTMTYRLDSDFSNPYGWVESIQHPLGVPPKPTDFPDLTFNTMSEYSYQSKFLETLKQKTHKKEKLVAWMVSNCNTHSQREDYVKELQKHIPVDIYGGCGKLKCKQLGNDQNHCWQNIEDNYKFYLSFENSICKEYVTEKFWIPMMMSSVVPVVLGSGNYTKMVPADSFIDAQMFETPAKLAEYLHKLNNNFTEYSKYLLWKTKFQVIKNTNNLAMCKICDALNDPTMPVKTYSNMKNWWRDQAQCKTKGSFPWSMIHHDYGSILSFPSLSNLWDGVKKDLSNSKVIV